MPPAWARFDIRQVSRKLVLACLVWLVLDVAWLGLVVRPRVYEYRRLDDQSHARIEALAARKAEVEARESFLNALRQAEQDLRELRTEWLGTRARQMVPVQLELSKLAQQFNIDLEQVQYQNSELEREALERFAMVVPLEGGYGNLRRFIQAVERSNKFLVIERVALGQTPEGGVLLQMNITLATYFDAPYLLRRLQQESPRRERGERPGPRPVPRSA
jgi:Tfp pilus assembly protein PilO